MCFTSRQPERYRQIACQGHRQSQHWTLVLSCSELEATCRPTAAGCNGGAVMLWYQVTYCRSCNPISSAPYRDPFCCSGSKRVCSERCRLLGLCICCLQPSGKKKNCSFKQSNTRHTPEKSGHHDAPTANVRWLFRQWRAVQFTPGPSVVLRLNQPTPQ